MGVELELWLSALVAGLALALALQSLRVRKIRRESETRDGRLEEATRKDELTGLSNRKVFQELLEREIAYAKRVQGSIGVAILDVDDLQLVNDGLGVAAGDEVLETLAARLARYGRESDTLARLGGDQFGLIVSRCESVSDILSAIYRLREIWQSPLSIGPDRLHVSCCVGLSVYPDDAQNVLELIGHAGTALAQAQRRGHNSVSVFDESSDRMARTRLVRSQELKRALERGEFEIHYQPQVSLPGGSITGAEGLVRWRHPDQGLLTAGHFIPLSEQMGLMPELSTWVIEEICRGSADWRAAGVPLVPISVNVSVRHFQAGNVPGVVARTLEETGLDPRFLHLEVTESAALHDVTLMTEQFQRLRGLGIEIQLDDFGTGYSSLAYLIRYPLNVLKIDRSFVSGVHEEADRRAIVKATLAMAESLGLRVIAEGVETNEELSCLVEMGCRYAQGYLLGRPMPREDFQRLLEQGRVDLPRPCAA